MPLWDEAVAHSLPTQRINLHTNSSRVDGQGFAKDPTEGDLVATLLSELYILQPKLQITFELLQNTLQGKKETHKRSRFVERCKSHTGLLFLPNPVSLQFSIY